MDTMKAHAGSRDYALKDPSGNERSEDYKLSLQGWLDVNCYKLQSAESILMRAAGLHPHNITKEGYREEMLKALRLVREVRKEMIGGR